MRIFAPRNLDIGHFGRIPLFVWGVIISLFKPKFVLPILVNDEYGILWRVSKGTIISLNGCKIINTDE